MNQLMHSIRLSDFLSHAMASKKSASSTLKNFGDRYIESSCADFPQWGSSLGFTKYESLLAGSDVGTHTSRIAFLEGLLSETEGAFVQRTLTRRLARSSLLLSLLRTELLNIRDLARYRTNPQECCVSAIGSIFRNLSSGIRKIWKKHVRQLKPA